MLAAADRLWPHRRTPGLAFAIYLRALIEAMDEIRIAERPQAETPAPKPLSLETIIAAARRFGGAVGLPTLDSEIAADPKRRGAATVIGFTTDPAGEVVRITHKGSLSALKEAADALAEILAATGREIVFRELMTTANIGTHRASIRIAPVGAKGRTQGQTTR